MNLRFLTSITFPKHLSREFENKAVLTGYTGIIMNKPININKEKYLRLKKDQQTAEKNNIENFLFDGKSFETSKTKYLVSYLDSIYN